MNSGVGVPIKLLHESQGHIVTCELKNSTFYRGNLLRELLRECLLGE